MTTAAVRIGILATHPIQYYAPWYRAIAARADLDVFFSHRQTADAQAAAGFGIPFEWDVPLTDGYRSRFLRNIAAAPDVNTFLGCDTPEVADIIAAGRFDGFIVHGWSNRSYWQAIRACRRSGTPVFVRGDSTLDTPRSWLRRALKWPLYRWFIPRFDGYLVVGQQAEAYLRHYGADPQRCFRSVHAVDNGFFAAGAARARIDRMGLRRSFDLDAEDVVLLFVGKFIEDKGALDFVDAIGRAARDNPRIVGLMAGDGPLRPDITRRIADGAAPVRLAGFLNQSDMVRAYAASDGLVVSSAHETWGLVVNEAMAAGLPVIASSGVGCAADLVEDDVTGYVFPVGDVTRLTAAIGRLAAEPAMRLRMAGAAVARVARFDVGEAADGAVRAVAAIRRMRPSDHTRATPNEAWQQNRATRVRR